MAWFKGNEGKKVKVKGFVPNPKPAQAPQIPSAPLTDNVNDSFDDNAIDTPGVGTRGAAYTNYGYGYGTGTGVWWQSAKGIAWDLKNGYSKSAKIEAAEKLARLNTDEALDELIDAVDVADKDVREAVFDAIAKIGTAKAVGRLIEKAVGKVGEEDKVEKIIDALKDEKNENKKLILMALKLDNELKAVVAEGVDSDLAKGLWGAGEAAFPLIAEIAKDGKKKKMLESALAAAAADVVSTALTADEKEIIDMAVGAVGDKGDYRFLPELIDAAVKTTNSANVQKAIISIEKKMGLKGFSLPEVSEVSETAEGQGVKNSRILFITEGKEIGASFVRVTENIMDAEADSVEYEKMDAEKLRKKALRYGTVVIRDDFEKTGSRLAYWLASKGSNVIYMSHEKDRLDELLEKCKCRCLKEPVNLKELIKMLTDDIEKWKQEKKER